MMKVMSCPGLRVVRSDEQQVVVEHPVTKDFYALLPLYASLLQLLEQPEQMDTLCGEGGTVPREVVEHLLDLGLLVDADDPQGAINRMLSPCQPTFARCPEVAPGEAQICIIGMPTDALSETGAGAAGAPAALRLASAFPVYELDGESGRPLGWYDYYTGRHVLDGVSFGDAGDVRMERGEAAAAHGARLTKVVERCLARDAFPLILGGDHSVTAWTLDAFGREPLSVLHLDAHSDLGQLAPQQTPTNGSVARAAIEQRKIEHLLSVGVRGFLPVEQRPLVAGHKIVSAREARRLRPDEIVALLPADLPCYVTLDVDVLDPSIAPGTNVPVPEGLSFAEVREILVAVGGARRIVGADVVEVNPERDPHLNTSRAAVHLILSLLGACFSQTTERQG